MSERSSGWSGSMPTITFQWCTLKVERNIANKARGWAGARSVGLNLVDAAHSNRTAMTV